MSTGTFVAVLRMLALMCANCPHIAVQLLKNSTFFVWYTTRESSSIFYFRACSISNTFYCFLKDIAETLRFLLMGANELKETESPEVRNVLWYISQTSRRQYLVNEVRSTTPSQQYFITLCMRPAANGNGNKIVFLVPIFFGQNTVSTRHSFPGICMLGVRGF